MGALALVIAVSFAACKGKSDQAGGDTTKVTDTTKVVDTTKKVVVDTVKKVVDTTKKDTTKKK